MFGYIMNRFHSILIRQIKQHRAFAWKDLVKQRAFLQSISDAYHVHDADHSALKRSLDASSNELLKANAEMRAIINSIPDQFFRLDADGRILDYRSGSGKQLSINHEDPTAHCLYDFVSEKTAQEFKKAIAGVLDTGDRTCFEVREDNDIHLEARMFPILDKQVLAIIQDISERKYSEQRIAHLAYHDSLTGLPNRLLFKDRLQLSIALARRHNHMVAVMFLDLDRFKHINDTLGHSIGDQLLVTIARRLRTSLRVSDCIATCSDKCMELPVTIARMGGDEFTIILSEIGDVQAVVKVARRILEVISQPFNLSGSEVFATVSIGIALYPIDGTDFETLVKNADSAMYHAKERGRNNYQLYTESMNAAAVERLILENSLHRAVERHELEVYYQPQMELATGKICSLEALMRWHHGDVGLIGPNIFIPLAEESDLILKLGKWLIEEVCRQVKTWEKEGHFPCRVDMNISAQQLDPDYLIPALAHELKRYQLSSRYIGIELTETAIVARPEMTAQVLSKVNEMGIVVAIDDFGTGYSSLSYLQNFPINALKIDQSFIRSITADPDNPGKGMLASAIIALGHSLGLTVVAEGVENDSQLEFLRHNNCDTIQGFLISQPVPAKEIPPFLQCSYLKNG